MTLDEIVKDSFESMPGRLKAGEIDPDFGARIGFEIGTQAWTLEMDGGSCRAEPSLEKDCDAVVQTGLDLLGTGAKFYWAGHLAAAKASSTGASSRSSWSLIEASKADVIITGSPGNSRSAGSSNHRGLAGSMGALPA